MPWVNVNDLINDDRERAIDQEFEEQVALYTPPKRQREVRVDRKQPVSETPGHEPEPIADDTHPLCFYPGCNRLREKGKAGRFTGRYTAACPVHSVQTSDRKRALYARKKWEKGESVQAYTTRDVVEVEDHVEAAKVFEKALPTAQEVGDQILEDAAPMTAPMVEAEVRILSRVVDEEQTLGELTEEEILADIVLTAAFDSGQLALNIGQIVIERLKELRG